MKKLLLTSLLCVAAGWVMGQEKKLSAITAPSSPASYMLGSQPASVLAPKSFQALETALFTNFLNNEGKTVLPNDFALEFTPYWATDHGRSLQDYLSSNEFLDQFWQNSSFSVGSSQNFLLEDKTATSALGIGYRTRFFIGGKADKQTVTTYIKTLSVAQRTLSKLIADISPLYPANATRDAFLTAACLKIDADLKNLFPTMPADELTALLNQITADAKLLSTYTSDNDKFQTDFNNLLQTDVFKTKTVAKFDLIDVADKFEAYIKNRLGFSLDVAYGTFLNLTTNKLDYSIVPKQSVWITPAYNFKNGTNNLQLLGVLRYEWFDQDYYHKYFPSAKSYRNNFDYGLAGVADFEKFAFQLEAVGRYQATEISAGTDASGNQLYRKEKASAFQCVGTFSYRLSKEIAVSYSLGNRFPTITAPDKTLVSLLSLNFGFGGPSKPAQ